MIDLGPQEPTERTEWTVLLAGDLGSLGSEHLFKPLEGERFARARATHWERLRGDVTATVLRRRVRTEYGPWEPAPDEP